jgi:hypothetical protein
MANYFNYFSKTPYTLDDTKTSVENVVNITKTFRFDSDFLENSAVYYEYNVKDGETPEILADKIYGSPERHWIILSYNNIVDPKSEWVMSYNTLIDFVDKKYSSEANTQLQETGFSWSQSNYKLHTKIITKTINSNGLTEIQKLVISQDEYTTLTPTTETFTLADGTSVTYSISKERKSYYDYEVDLNESKRSIKLLRPEFVFSVEQEFQKLQ